MPEPQEALYRRASDAKIEQLSQQVATLNTNVAVLAVEMRESGKRQEDMLSEIKELKGRMNGHDRKFAWYAGATSALLGVWEIGKTFILGGHK